MRLGVAVLLLSLLCSPFADAAPAEALIKDVPHVLQKPDFCGEACAEMILRRLGKNWTQDQVFNASGLDPALGRGCYTVDLARAIKSIGFVVGDVWYRVPADDAKSLDAQWNALHADLVKGIASIVCMHYEDKPSASEHFRLILGYDPAKDDVIYNEPAEPKGEYRRMKRQTFLSAWPLKHDAKTSTVVRIRLEPGRLADPPKAAAGFTSADYAQAVHKLKEKLPAGFTIVIEPPFVVVGDEAPQIVRAHSTRTVEWAVEKLKADYFAKDPAHVLTVWLFRDKASYDKYTREIFNDRPSTPYGYYSDAHKALIMNIATGGGTLVHEIVHPFMHTNFPECPPWFNEGMGSLYEQCNERGGHIIGMTNWRLAGLQEAIAKKKVPSFKELCEMDEDAFYGDARGTNYAQARYLCYYLQEKGLLVQYYKDFTASKKTDASGYKTLQKILNEKDMDDFKKRWEAYVMKLSFP